MYSNVITYITILNASDKDDDDLPPKVSEFNKLRRDVQHLHLRLHTHIADCEKTKITLADLEAVLKRMNVTTMSKKQMVSPHPIPIPIPFS